MTGADGSTLSEPCAGVTVMDCATGVRGPTFPLGRLDEHAVSTNTSATNTLAAAFVRKRRGGIGSPSL
ncbi:hypothetical protein NSK11_contig00102-0013 [Nocardia seriolae]|uniref:Uncharacterized protein n=1 Tax=Nocardia seriolae TaxID=37332 RepID=A0ABC9YZW4_9NOCA|nr:hypothetical protein NSK11_contig00102-0013 [Nocardia seriolae]